MLNEGEIVVTQTEADSDRTLQRILQIYQIEPIGYILLGRLHVSLSLIWSFFVLLCFGVLLILHGAVGTPKPATSGDIFKLPSTFYYYPNLIAITYDLIGIPLFLTMLVLSRDYIPKQFKTLRKNSLIVEKTPKSKISKILLSSSSNSVLQLLVIAIFPFLIATIGLLADILVFSPQDTPALYSTFLSFLGRYARSSIFVQIIYIFVVLSNYKLNPRIYIGHPDGCSGLSPLGKLAILAYIYLFTNAMMQAIGAIAGGGGLVRAIGSTIGSSSLIYLWLLFPLALIIVFSQLIYKPHDALLEYQRQYLYNISINQTDYHHQVLSSIETAVKQSKTSLADKTSYHFNDDLELLEAWTKLNRSIEEVHTWPIPKRTFQFIAVLANPLIPILLPIIVDVVKNFLP